MIDHSQLCWLGLPWTVLTNWWAAPYDPGHSWDDPCKITSLSGLTWDDPCSVWSTIKSRDSAYIYTQDYHGMTSDLPNDPSIHRTSQGCPLLGVGLLSSIPRTPQDYSGMTLARYVCVYWVIPGQINTKKSIPLELNETWGTHTSSQVSNS